MSTVLSLYHGDQIGCQGEIASDTPVWTHERENRRRPSCSSVVPPQTNSGLMCCASFPRMHRRVRRTELARQLGGAVAASESPRRRGPRAWGRARAWSFLHVASGFCRAARSRGLRGAVGKRAVPRGPSGKNGGTAGPSGPFRGTRTIRSWVGLGLYARAATSHSVIQ